MSIKIDIQSNHFLHQSLVGKQYSLLFSTLFHQVTFDASLDYTLARAEKMAQPVSIAVPSRNN